MRYARVYKLSICLYIYVKVYGISETEAEWKQKPLTLPGVDEVVLRRFILVWGDDIIMIDVSKESKKLLLMVFSCQDAGHTKWVGLCKELPSPQHTWVSSCGAAKQREMASIHMLEAISMRATAFATWEKRELPCCSMASMHSCSNTSVFWARNIACNSSAMGQLLNWAICKTRYVPRQSYRFKPKHK